MQTRSEKQAQALIRQDERDKRSDEQQIERLKKTRGESKKEIARLQERIAKHKAHA